MSMFSYFDTGKNPQEKSRRGYHGFVLGIDGGISGSVCSTSNRESGFGRYDVMLEPRRAEMTG